MIQDTSMRVWIPDFRSSPISDSVHSAARFVPEADVFFKPELPNFHQYQNHETVCAAKRFSGNLGLRPDLALSNAPPYSNSAVSHAVAVLQ